MVVGEAQRGQGMERPRPTELVATLPEGGAHCQIDIPVLTLPYRQLVREKERLQARCEKLEVDLERRRKRVLDADFIRRALQDSSA